MGEGNTVPQPKPASADLRLFHAHAIKTAITGTTSVLNNLITLYSQSNLLSHAVRLFWQIPSPNIVSWTALISAYANTHLALRHFISMLRHPTLPNQRTLATLFKTCASLPHMSFGLQLHSLSLKLSLAHLPFSGSALIHLYSRCRLPVEARKVFDRIPDRDEVCYAAVIVGLAQNSRSSDALSLFVDMRSAGVGSTMYSVSGALRAASEVAALEQCRIIHAHAVVTGLNLNVVVGTALVDGYGKSGLVSDAHSVFSGLFPDVNIVGWNAMMAGYAQQGDKQSVLELFSKMANHRFVADDYSFLAILTACSNAGSVHEVRKWLNAMKLDYGLEPGIEHYTCVVGAMARAGQLEEAKHLAMTMPFKPDAAVWRTLLSSCAVHCAADIAWVVGQRLLELDPQDDSAYAILANVHAAAGRWEEVAQVRKQMKDRRVRKEGGQSWIEVRGEVHVFLAGDRRHERTMEIYAKLTDLLEEIRKLGYVEVSDAMLHEVEAAEKREALWYHSEKLAVAFGLISGAAPPGKPLRVVKNLRICRDCHEAFKYFSRVIEREIVVRDVNRYHRFVNGICACGDYW
ncbi:pentatricopeptide repeat-containing protein At4g33170-like [Macadamia integrifolia]|uniref:pentatricopeptide repeat-containing protein At4g33170-like n=1 Tax=Macadamia integrifolia TaxID=60698 RepID=UPI001C4E99C6|nr:pentatricopeptide repeat-containing protein At4g33170-like [Macadamia integrifolia]XP_042514645.1 pentatricopeptide repeat-containing protein At4g33170-like [Macadamia integrifolia]